MRLKENGAELGSRHVEKTAKGNLASEVEIVRPDPCAQPSVGPSPRMSKHCENRCGNDPGAALLPSQVKRLKHWLPSRHGAIQRLWSGKGGRKLAIHMQCLDCCGEDVEAVRTCGDRCCPLWHFRPFQQRAAQ
jgi:hypothetical protein